MVMVPTLARLMPMIWNKYIDPMWGNILYRCTLCTRSRGSGLAFSLVSSRRLWKQNIAWVPKSARPSWKRARENKGDPVTKISGSQSFFSLSHIFSSNPPSHPHTPKTSNTDSIFIFSLKSW